MCSARPSVRADRLGDRRRDERGVAERGETDPEDPCLVGGDEHGGGLERKPRLAGAAGTGERDEARTALDQREHVGELAARVRRMSLPAAEGSCSRSS